MGLFNRNKKNKKHMSKVLVDVATIPEGTLLRWLGTENKGTIEKVAIVDEANEFITFESGRAISRNEEIFYEYMEFAPEPMEVYEKSKKIAQVAPSKEISTPIVNNNETPSNKESVEDEAYTIVLYELLNSGKERAVDLVEAYTTLKSSLSTIKTIIKDKRVITQLTNKIIEKLDIGVINNKGDLPKESTAKHKEVKPPKVSKPTPSNKK